MSEFVETPEGLIEPQPRRERPDDPVLAGLAERFSDMEWGTSYGQWVLAVPRESFREVAEAAREAGFETCVDVTAVDYLARTPRFEVVAMLVSQQHLLRLRLRAGVPGEEPTLPSLEPVYSGTNYFEREVYDMFGIEFTDHPDMTRILMPDDWEGHPLRKDYPVGGVPVQFKAAHRMS